MRPPTGPDSFVLTYKFFETKPPRELAPPPSRLAPPPTGNPGSATAFCLVSKVQSTQLNWKHKIRGYFSNFPNVPII